MTALNNLATRLQMAAAYAEGVNDSGKFSVTLEVATEGVRVAARNRSGLRAVKMIAWADVATARSNTLLHAIERTLEDACLPSEARVPQAEPPRYPFPRD